MLLIYIAALAGILRFRSREYWKWLSILLAWMLGTQFLFAGGGTLEDPTGDGLITHQIRIATNDGGGMGIFAIVFILAYWGGVIWIVGKLFVTAKRVRRANLQREWDSSEQVSTGRKLAETVALTLIAAAYVYVALVAPRMVSQEPVSTIATRPVETETTDPVALALSQAANELKRKGPQKLDSTTTLVEVSAQGRVLTYHYEMSRRDGTDEQLRAFVRKHTVSAACQNSDMHRDMKDHGITFRYSYMMPNADAPVVVDATYAECQSLGLQ
jgi:hypothetical protein